MSISYKRRLFYKYYLVSGNGKEAALKANYSARSASTQASQMLQDPEGQEYLAELMADLDQLLHLSAADVRNELAKIATCNIQGIFHEDGSMKKPHEMDEATAASIASIKVKRDPILGDQFEYKLHPKMAALENLTKQHNLYEDNEKAGKGEIHIHLDDKDSQA